MGNEKHETIADIVAEMRKRAEEVYAGQDGYPESWKDQMDYGEIYDIADRIEAANKREHEATSKDSSVVGNTAKMREAVVKLLNFLRWEYAQDYPTPRDKLADAIDIGVAALSAPPRNCDVGTADEQAERHNRLCESTSRITKDCWVAGCRKCFIACAQMPYDGEAVE